MDFFEVVRRRRSVRKYAEEEVPLEDIKKIIETATLAPSAHNSRPWRFVVVTNRNVIKEMVALVHRWMDEVLKSPNVPEDLKVQYDKYRPYFTFYENAPAVIVVCGEPYESVPGKAVSLAFPDKAKASKVNSLEQSVSAATQNLILAATALGYGTCWATGPLLAADDMKKLLEIPENWEIFAIVPLGKPLKDLVPRRPQEFEEVARLIK